MSLLGVADHNGMQAGGPIVAQQSDELYHGARSTVVTANDLRLEDTLEEEVIRRFVCATKDVNLSVTKVSLEHVA
jgi:hypothetical protein